MERKSPPANKMNKAQSREDRLKAALKANMGRRKTQARARAAGDSDTGRSEAGNNKGQD